MAAKTIENVKPADGSSGQRTAAPQKVLRPHTPPANGEKPMPSARNRVQGVRCSDTAPLRTTAGALAPTCRLLPENNHPRCRGFIASAEIDPGPVEAAVQPLSQGRGWRLAHRPDRNSVDSQEKSGFRDKKLEVTRPFAAGTPSTCRRDGSPRHLRSPSRRGGSRPAVHTVHYQFTFFYFSVHQPTVPAIAR